MPSYPAKYSDAHGEEVTTIHNDGKTLRMIVRGVEFSGIDFDSFEFAEKTERQKLKLFSFGKFGDLCSYNIECEIPLQIRYEGASLPASLLMKLELGNAREDGGIDKEKLSLILKYQDKEFRSSSTSGWFEDELLDLQKKLPEDHHLKCCFGCAYADYFPAGHGLFGGMLCFKNSKEQYLAVKTKADYWPVLDRGTDQVQETHLCPEFEVRKPGTGYRG